MRNSKFYRLFHHLISGDIAWLIHRIRLYSGIRTRLSKPEVLQSIFERPSAFIALSNHSKYPIKLLVFSHNLDYEGASISLKELVLGLMGHEVLTTQVISFKDGPLRAEYQAKGIEVVVLPDLIDQISTLARLDKAVSRLAAHIKNSGVDLVFVNTLINFPAILAAELAQIPSVWNPRESEPWYSYFNFLPEPVASRAVAAIGLPRKVIFVANATRAVWKDFDQLNTFEVIHNGLNLTRFTCEPNGKDRERSRSKLAIDDESIVILSVGTLCERKGQMDIIAALERLPQYDLAKIRVLLVGEQESEYARAIKNRCRLLPANLAQRIEFHSPTDSIDNYYVAADCFVLSSKVESFPRVILEAMLFGLPIITTPVFGVTEQVIENENALFYSPGDSQQLTKHLRKLLNDKGVRQRMSESSFNRSREMTSFDEMLITYASTCKDVVATTSIAE